MSEYLFAEYAATTGVDIKPTGREYRPQNHDDGIDCGFLRRPMNSTGDHIRACWSEVDAFISWHRLVHLSTSVR